MIVTAGLTKRYGQVTALDGLTMRVESGEIFGFLGPNGAGKTTTIRLLLGMLKPTGGVAEVLGRPVGSDGTAIRGDVGYLPGELSLWPELTGWITLRFLEQLTTRTAVDRDELLQRLDLRDDQLRRPVRTYSDGMKQKLGLVQALQCRPRLVFLDEPTKGLDPLVQQAFYEIVSDARSRGASIFFSSHILPEVERICDRVAILRSGHLVAAGSVTDVMQSQRRRVRASFASSVNADALTTLGEVVSRTERGIELLVPRADVPEIVRQLGSVPVSDVTIEPLSLEDAFLEHYR